MSQSGIIFATKSNFSDVPRPLGNNLTYFLNANDGDRLYAMKSNGSVFPVNAGGAAAAVYASGAFETVSTVITPNANPALSENIPFIIISAVGVTPLPNQFQIDETGVYEITFNVSTTVQVN